MVKALNTVTMETFDTAPEALRSAGAQTFLAGRDPNLIDELEASLPHLWDHGDSNTRDDEAVREVARGFLRSLRAAQSDRA